MTMPVAWGPHARSPRAVDGMRVQRARGVGRLFQLHLLGGVGKVGEPQFHGERARHEPLGAQYGGNLVAALFDQRARCGQIIAVRIEGAFLPD